MYYLFVLLIYLAYVLLLLFSVWARLLDTENMYDFLCRHLDQNGRRKLIYGMSLFYSIVIHMI